MTEFESELGSMRSLSEVKVQCMESDNYDRFFAQFPLSAYADALCTARVWVAARVKVIKVMVGKEKPYMSKKKKGEEREK